MLIRGAGHPDLFPHHAPRLHRATVNAYGLDASAATDVTRLAGIADRWRPYRSWVAPLLRTRDQATAGGPTCRGPSRR
ncbi:hypothetical protein [Kitasatospora sp. NPDC058190]|uniref:hypothetical protein n=1 Tax=Kitasatospora sp. NPDC058190 TaxID=3346371 RepID=UPI0036DD0614